LIYINKISARHRHADPDMAVSVETLRPVAAGLHIWQQEYSISTGAGSLELGVMLFSPEIVTSNTVAETATPSEHDAEAHQRPEGTSAWQGLPNHPRREFA
jgi:hypothetical protein